MKRGYLISGRPQSYIERLSEQGYYSKQSTSNYASNLSNIIQNHESQQSQYNNDIAKKLQFDGGNDKSSPDQTIESSTKNNYIGFQDMVQGNQKTLYEQMGYC